MGREQRNNFNMEDAYDLRLNKFVYVTVCHRPYKDKNVAHHAVLHEQVSPTAPGHDSRYSIAESSVCSQLEDGA
jgi:hypothetical protein